MKLDLSVELFRVLTLLLPGFITVGVIRSLCVEEGKTDVDKIIRALAYSFLVYCLLPPAKWLIAMARHHPRPSMKVALVIPQTGADVITLLCLSVLLALLVAWYRQLDGHRLLRLLRLTSRTARLDIWHDVFADKKNCDIAIVFKDGRQLFGWPAYCSDDAQDRRLFLTQARWSYYDGDNELVEAAVPDPGILVLCPDQIEFIQFQSRIASACLARATDDGMTSADVAPVVAGE